MLATLVGSKPPGEWIYEMKYDGFRAISAVVDGETAVWSRNALDLLDRFPTIGTLLERIYVESIVLDGEIVVLDESGAPRFQLLQQAAGSNTHYFVFDLLYLNGHDLRKQTFRERRELLEKVLAKLPAQVKKHIQPSRLVEESPDEALKRAAAEGWEGLIAKDPQSKYEGRRSKAWVKLKAVNAQELVVIGFTPASNTDREIGALLLGVHDDGELRFAGKVGTGFSSKLRSELKMRLEKDRVAKSPAKDAPRIKVATWVEPKLVAQVSFTEWTSDGKLRHPSFLGLRPDKKPKEVVRERPVAPPPKPPSASKTSSTKGLASPRSGAKQAATPLAKPESTPSKTRSGKRSAANVTVQLTSPDRVLYPRDGITKLEVAAYYEAMSPYLVAALKDRPLALEHWNQGIDKGSWFHQNIGNEAQPWMTLIDTPTRTSKRTIRHLAGNDEATFRWLAQNSVLTLHMWSSHMPTLEEPDWIIIDLDPARGAGIEQAIESALIFRKLFEDLGMPSLPKTSGKRGIHLLVPIKRGATHEEAVDFACRLADAVAAKVPTVTTERAIAQRKGRLYLDCLQNGYGKTIVAPYSLRAIDGAPVSAPLEWSEVTKKLDPMKFNLRTMPDRVAKKGDLFAAAMKKPVKLPTLQ